MTIESEEIMLEKYAPVNVKLKRPTENIENWDAIAYEWKKLNNVAHGNPGFYPLTIKGAYVIGIIHDICESVDSLVHHPHVFSTTYIPAIGVFSSGIEILGRCINGNTNSKNTTKDLVMGYKWLASISPTNIPENYSLIRTKNYEYSIEMLVALRHFAAHGQATSEKVNGVYKFGKIDFEILEKLLPLLAKGLSRYWQELLDSEEMCNKLARANIISLRDWPIHKSWILFEKDRFGKYHTISEIFTRFDWQINKKPSPNWLSFIKLLKSMDAEK